MFKTTTKAILQDLSALGESGSEGSHFIPDPKNFAKVTRLLDETNKPCLN